MNRAYSLLAFRGAHPNRGQFRQHSPTAPGLIPHHSIAILRCRGGMLPNVDHLRAELGHLRIPLSVIAGIHQPYVSPQYIVRLWHKSVREYLCREEIAR